MKCKKCNDKEAKGDTGLCDPCRLKKWRRDNPEKVKAYYEMRKVRDKDKFKVRQYYHWNDFYFGGNRIKVLERDSYTCQVCGAKKSDGTKIIVHHKDCTGWGKNKNEKNNDMNNLITLCQPCHVKIHKPYNHKQSSLNLKELKNE
jgi:5-methylcytosine-specific restriction endonuclease McrA